MFIEIISKFRGKNHNRTGA